MPCTGDGHATPSDSDYRVYEIFRGRITQEDALINNRITWLILLEASLLSAWGVIASGRAIIGLDQEIVLGFLGIFGLVVALFVLASIWAAHVEIKKCKKDYRENFAELYRNPKIPRVTGNKISHNIGHIVPFIAPIMFVLAQGCLFYADWRLYKTGGDVALKSVQQPVVLPPSDPAASKSGERSHR